jgi:rhodanese-related sulfurtransferase
MQRIEPHELNDELRSGEVMVLDLRSEKAYEQADEHITGDRRYSPDRVEQWWNRLPKDRHIVAYCT